MKKNKKRAGRFASAVSAVVAAAMLAGPLPGAALAADGKEEKTASEAVLAEYEQWSRLPYEQRTGYPKNQNLPFTLMFVVYTDVTVDGKRYTLSDESRRALPDQIETCEYLLEKWTDHNVDLIIDTVYVDRPVATDYNFSTADCAPELERYGGGAYNWLWLQFSVMDHLFWAHAQCIGRLPGQAVSVGHITTPDNGGYNPHELLHSIYPVYVEFGLAPLNFDRLIDQSGEYGYKDEREPMIDLLRANVKVTDAETGETRYTGFWPSMWRAAAEGQTAFAARPVDPDILGTWKAVDFVDSISDFDPALCPEEMNYYFAGVDFGADGMAVLHTEKGGSYTARWGRGAIAWDLTPTYATRIVDGETYLFLPWMSGDVERGAAPFYYVCARTHDADGNPVVPPSLPGENSGLESADPWAAAGIRAAIDRGYVPADLQGDYTAVITRREFCRLAVEFVECFAGKNIDAVLAEHGTVRDFDAFTDTGDADILAACALGVTNGTGGRAFSPGAPFSREQAAVMLKNVCALFGMDTEAAEAPAFADLDSVAGWALGGVTFCCGRGIMNGTGGNQFTPQKSYTRQEAIITFERIKSLWEDEP